MPSRPSSWLAGGEHSGHTAETVPAAGGTSLNALSQPPDPAQGAISGKVEQGRGHLAGESRPRTQAAPKGAQAARGHRPGGHHAAAGTGRAALSGTCASTQPPVLQVGDWQGWSGRRAGRAERERQPCWPLCGARSPCPAPRVHAHGTARVHTDLHTHTRACASGPANTHVCTWTFTCVHTQVRTQTCTDTHTHTRAHGPMHTHMHTDLCTWTLHVCVHTQPLLVRAHRHVSVHACTEILSTHVCTHRAFVHTPVCTQSLHTSHPYECTDILCTSTYNATDARAAFHQDGHAGVPGFSPVAGSAHAHTGTHTCAHTGMCQPPAQPWHSL